MNGPTVSVVLLSYNRPHLLAAALEGLSAQTYANLDVTIVDNQSAGSAAVAAIAARYPAFRLIANPTNQGFTGGMNLGIRQATGEYVCLTEDDLILEPDYVATMVEYFRARPETGLASGLLFNHGARTLLCAGGTYRLGPVFQFRLIGEGDRNADRFAEPFEVPFISGAMVFARRGFLQQELNGFREDFFVYHEDIDLCQRARRAGRSVVIVPGARGYHVEPPPGRTSDVVQYHKYKNLYAIYWLHAPASVLPAFVLRYGPWAVLKALASGQPRDAQLISQAWCYVLPRIPLLLRQRQRVCTGSALPC